MSDTHEMQAILRRIETLEKENMRLRRTRLTRRPRFVLTLGACVLLAAGVVVGQRVRPSKFAKYQEPAFISRMDWLLMQAKVENISANWPMGNITLPNIYFDSRTNKVVAIALVNAERLGSETADSLRHDLEMSAIMAEGPVHELIPELTQQDFEMEFRALDLANKTGRNEPGKDYYIFAEHKNGELILH
jgi:hypothetical protein